MAKIKKNKILLYNSINRPVFASHSHPDPINLGLLALSSVLKKNGYQVKLIPNIDSKKTLEYLKKELKGTLLVGVSCMTGDPINNGIKFSRAVKLIDPKIPICWGGFHPTLDYENTIKNEFVDYVIRGQGENVILELVKSIENNKSKLSEIKGLVYKKKDKIKVNCLREIEPIDNFPFFDYELYYDCYKIEPVDEIIYCSSRGCPFECTFCSVSTFYHRRYLFYSKERFFQDTDKIVKRYNPKSIFFWDDNFFTSPQRSKEFLKNYLKNGYHFKWYAFARCDLFSKEDKDFLRLLKKCNCVRLLFGAESGSKRILKYIKKHIEIEDIINSCKNVSKYGIVPDYTFISGFPTETLDDLAKTLKIIKKIIKINKNSGVRLFSFNISPGIPILADCLKLGITYPKSLEEWAKFEYHSFIAPWISKKHREMVKILVWITSFASLSTAPTHRNLIINMLLKLIHKDAYFRLTRDFYFLAFEWKLLYFFYKRHYSRME
ncbi:B12-binding domain-containing radical SAM protein [Patescibacteria group bacterium]|nr:B12-binding domain-containing radical SAM protein [Patescibacteria group bacterium]